MGLASLLKMMWADEYVDEKDARFINDRVHANIQKDGTFSVVPQMKGGVTTPEQLRKIADVAEKYDVPMVKLTGGQRIDLLGIRKEDLPGVWADLGHAVRLRLRQELPDGEDLRGQEFCRFGIGDSTKLGIEIESRFQGTGIAGQDEAGGLRVPAQLRRVLRQGRRHRGRSRAAAGRSTSAARPARTSARATCSPPSTTPRRPSCSPAGSCSTTGRTPSGWSGPTRSCPRVGLDHIRAVIVDDSRGHRGRPGRRGCRTSIDTYVTPGRRARTGHPRPVPHLAAAGGAAAGAGPS